jgi:methyl-accepting chemotaxis protein
VRRFLGLRSVVPIPGVAEQVIDTPVVAQDSLITVSPEIGMAIDMIESDVRRALERLSGLISSSRQMSEGTAGDLEQIHGGMAGLSAASDEANRNIAGLAAATEQVSTSVELVSRNADDARLRIASIAEQAKAARAVFDTLSAASGEIAGISDTIVTIARQTNLLALNATIEASRAGEAGRSFAIVAGEVKALSLQTGAAVNDIRQRISQLEAATLGSVNAIGDIVRLINDVNPMVAAIGDAMHEQAQSATELSRRAQDTARFVETVTMEVGKVDALAVHAARQSLAAAGAARKSASESEGLAARFVPVIRQTSFADRRKHDRFPVELLVIVETNGGRWSGTTVDVSQRGCLIARPADCALRAGDNIRASINGQSGLDLRIAAVSVLGFHCAAQGLATELALVSFSDPAEHEYNPLIVSAQQIAEQVVTAFEKALQDRALSEATLFDTTYKPLAGSEPEQFETPSLPVLRSILPPIQEPALAQDKRLVFCLAIDRNGYIPVHNTIYSQPQRPGEPLWNAANCRDRRMFNDRTGIIAARSMRPFVVQAYRRDMGGGQFVLMREIDVPLTVRGRHWGGLRMAYRF